MEHSSFTKHLPYVLKVCTTLDVNTKLFNNYLISFKIFLNVLFFFSTISCMSDSKGLLSDFLSKYHDLLVVLMSLSVEICLIKYKSQFCTLITFIMEPLEDFEPYTVTPEIVKDYNREIALCGKVAVAFYVFCAPYAFAPLLLLVFDTSKLGNKECTDLAYGWVWRSDSYWYLIPANIISVILFLLEIAVLFYYYLVMAYVTVKVRFTIRLICANLDDMNRMMNWSEKRPSEFNQERFQPVKPGILVSGETMNSTGNSLYWEENSMILTTQTTNGFRVSEAGRQQSSRRKEDIMSYELQMKIWDKILSKKIKLFMANMVERHVKIIRCVKLADITFRIQVMVYVQLGVIAVAFAAPKLSLGKQLINIDYTSQAVEFLGFLVLMGLISYIGQTLLDESESLRQALYNCDWTDKPRSLRRDLLIMQTVATKPLKLTVGGIYTLGMETYGNIVRAVYSYTSLIQTLK